jgi:hypothetical protein
MSETDAIDGAVGPVHTKRHARRLSALRARLAAARLDLELANGADPWSSTELMCRAARVSSLVERRKLAAGLEGLVHVAAAKRPMFSVGVPVRRELVIDYVEELLMVAERLRELEPLDVSLLAELAFLVRDGRSPVYVGGRPPYELTRVTARALAAIEPS